MPRVDRARAEPSERAEPSSAEPALDDDVDGEKDAVDCDEPDAPASGHHEAVGRHDDQRSDCVRQCPSDSTYAPSMARRAAAVAMSDALNLILYGLPL